MTALRPHRGGSGEPLVLLHGFTDTQFAWTRLLPALERRHDVFAPTLPGHHGGPPFPAGTRLSTDTTADAVERMMDEAGIDRAHIVGSSLGGWLALKLAGRGRALSVVGLCPAGGYEHGTREARRTNLYFRRNDLLLRRFGPLLPLVASRPRTRYLALRELVARPHLLSSGEALRMMEGAAGCSIVRDALDLARTGDLFGELERIDCPVRIAYGTRDRILRWPGHYTRLKAMLPDADWVPLDGLGHLPMWDDPDRVAEVILEVTAAEREPLSASFAR